MFKPELSGDNSTEASEIIAVVALSLKSVSVFFPLKFL